MYRRKRNDRQKHIAYMYKKKTERCITLLNIYSISFFSLTKHKTKMHIAYKQNNKSGLYVQKQKIKAKTKNHTRKKK